MASWADLGHELDQWRTVGVRPCFWWRDDDAQKPTAALDKLLNLSAAFAVPLHLSVIPQGCSTALAARLEDSALTWVLQHGFAHINHEPKGASASEVGDNRDLDLQRADLAAGWQRLQAAGLPRLLRVLVPPWNRISDRTLTVLPDLGYRIVSTYAGRTADPTHPDLRLLDTHLDPIRWKYGNAFRGQASMLAMTVDALKSRRLDGDQTAPIGLVTHHLQTGDDIWAFLDDFFSFTTRDDTCAWLRLVDLPDLN